MVYLIYRWAGDDFSHTTETEPSGCDKWIALNIPYELAELALDIANAYIAISLVCNSEYEIRQQVCSDFINESQYEVNLILDELSHIFERP